jgi:ABC-2 type transport system permease protein
VKNFGVLFRSCLLRSKKLLLLTLILTLGVMAISALASAPDEDGEGVGEAFRLGLIDRDGSAAAKDMASWFEDSLHVKLVKTKDRDELDSELLNKRISGIAEIPEGFQSALLDGDPEPVRLAFLDDYANESFVRGYFDVYMESAAVLSAAADGDAAAFEKLLAETGREEPEVGTARGDGKIARQESEKEGFRYMLGFFMMFNFIMSITVMQMLHTDRLGGTFRRIKASNVTSVAYVSSIACIGFIISLLIEGPALFFWHVTGSHMGVPLGATVLMLLAFSVLVNSISILVGIVMPSFSGIISVVVALSTISSMLGGAWFPLEMAPPLFKAASKFTPQYWVYEALYPSGNMNGALGAPLAILLLAALILLILAGVRFSGNRSAAGALAR